MAGLKLALLLTLNFSIDLHYIFVSLLLLKSPFYGEFGPRTLICFSALLYSKSIEKIRDHQKSFNNFRRSYYSACLRFAHKICAKFKLRQNIALQGAFSKRDDIQLQTQGAVCMEKIEALNWAINYIIHLFNLMVLLYYIKFCFKIDLTTSISLSNSLEHIFPFHLERKKKYQKHIQNQLHVTT